MSEFNAAQWESSFSSVTQDIYYRALQDHEISPEEVLKPLEEEIHDDANFNYRFDKKLSDAIIASGYDGDDDDIAAKALFLTKRLSQLGAKIDGQTVRSWLRAERFPQNTENTRRNALYICFALKMTLEQSIDFMQNVLFVRAFNFRDPLECIAFYALKNGMDWKWVQQTDSEVREMRGPHDEHSDIKSIEIAEGLGQVVTPDDLKRYLLKNVPENAASLRRAKETVRSFTADALELARENAKADNSADGLNKNTIAFLLRAIYGSNMRDTRIKAGMKKKAHALIVTNFPMGQEFSEMLAEDGSPSADMLRKAIILLVFYNSFARLKPTDPSSEEYYNRFVEETQYILEECCLPLLHPRNPYDRIFLYCACQEDGESASEYLDEFRDIINSMLPSEER